VPTAGPVSPPGRLCGSRPGVVLVRGSSATVAASARAVPTPGSFGVTVPGVRQPRRPGSRRSAQHPDRRGGRL